ncbi:putative integrase [Halorhodospira halochloris]|uniref:Integrase n=1 Tax=Halorhodospira halochloris TaxID=1052 RepID=A0A0X8X9U0_HALHR|nr:tyrosine-type recombinase/integrase [Halorhodospira halochloris]MBK1652560.1 hypothetical protein [Halorhodospira halochloris]BAU58147.1 putative integrase [Halorhodospira halochloris]
MGRKRQKDKSLPPRMHWKNGAWYHVTSMQPRRWTRLSANRAEATRKWAEIEARQQADDGTVGDLLARYEKSILPSKAEKTQIEYRRQLSKLKAVFGSAKPDDIKPHHVAQYLDMHAYPTTANREVALLSAVYAEAMRWGLADNNPCRGIRRNKEKPRDRYIEDAELEALRRVANERIKAIIDIAYLTALRKGDLLNLRLSDLYDDWIQCRVGKTGQEVRIGWSDALREAVSRARKLPRRASSMYLLANRNGQPYTVSGFDTEWKKVVAKSGIGDVHFHDIRAKALTDIARDRGRDAAQALAAHLVGETTEAYVRAREKHVVAPTR